MALQRAHVAGCTGQLPSSMVMQVPFSEQGIHLRLLQAALLLSKQQVHTCCPAPCWRMYVYWQSATRLLPCTSMPHVHACALLQIPLETLSWRVERAQSVSTGLLQLVGLKEVDTLVCGIAGYR